MILKFLILSLLYSKSAMFNFVVLLLLDVAAMPGCNGVHAAERDTTDSVNEDIKKNFRNIFCFGLIPRSSSKLPVYVLIFRPGGLRSIRKRKKKKKKLVGG